MKQRRKKEQKSHLTGVFAELEGVTARLRQITAALITFEDERPEVRPLVEDMECLHQRLVAFMQQAQNAARHDTLLAEWPRLSDQANALDEERAQLWGRYVALVAALRASGGATC